MRRVVITGMGAVTPYGMGVDTYWENLLAKKSGIKKLDLDPKKFGVRIGGTVENFNPEKYLSRIEIRRYDKFLQYGLIAAYEAIEDAGLDKSENYDKDRVGVIIGSGIGGLQLFEDQHSFFLETCKVSPYFIPMLIVNMVSGVVAIKYKFRGPNFATVSACATANHAIGVAFDMIKAGRADIMVCGGAESAITSLGVQGFTIMRALSTRNDEPEKASRPFDKDRDGFVMGEGAGVVVLEELEHAKKRGAKIYAELIGFGMSADAYDIVAPCPDGDAPALSIQRCIQNAGIKPEDVDYINAHGTATPIGDIAEIRAIKKAFGKHAYKLLISSTKSLIGHLLGAAGGVELIATILMIRNSVIIPTVNLDNYDPEIDLDCVPNEIRKKDIKIALSNSFGFGGHNSTLAIKKYVEE